MGAIYVPSTLKDLGSSDANGLLLESLLPIAGTPPSGFASLVCDIDAADVTGVSSGATISTFTEKKGNIFIGGSGSANPLWVADGINGRPAFKFDSAAAGTAQFLYCSTGPTFDRGAFTVACVLDWLAAEPNSGDIWGFPGASNKNILATQAHRPYFFDSASGNRIPNAGVRRPRPVVLTTVSDTANGLARHGWDGIEYTAASVETSLSGAGFSLGNRYPTGAFFTFGGRILVARCLVFAAALTPAQVLSLSRWLHRRYDIESFGEQPTRLNFLVDGSSIHMGATASYQSRAWWGLLAQRLPVPGARFTTVGFGGATSAGLQSTFAARVAPYINPSADQNIILFAEGTNGGSASYTGDWSYTTTATAAGAKVIGATIVSRGGASDANNATYNAGLRAGWRSNGMANLAEVNLDPYVGVLGSYANTTYFNGDQTHLTDAGNAREVPYWEAAIRATLRGLPGGFSGPIPALGAAVGATTVTTNTVPLSANTGGLVRFSGSARRTDSGAEFAAFTGYQWLVTVASGTATVAAIGSGTATYSAAGMSTAAPTLVASGQGIALQFTGEAGKTIFLEGTLTIDEAL